MRPLLLATFVCLVAGCSAPDLPSAAETQKKADEAKLRQAKAAFAAFLDEAVKAAELLESHPEADKLQEQIRRLNALLDRATDVYPDHPKMDEVGKRCKGIVRFFTASLSTIQRNFTGKAQVSEKTKKGVYGACDSNASAARQTAEDVRASVAVPGN